MLSAIPGSIMILLALLLASVHAQSGSSSSSVDAGSLLNTSDPCRQPEYVNDCWYPVSCKTCLTRDGCAVQVSTGSCVSIGAESYSDASTSGFFLSGEVEYCSAADPACISCRRSNEASVCLGLHSCVCVAKCEQISTTPTRCAGGMAEISTTSLVLAGIVLIPLVMYIMVKGCCDVSISRALRRRRARHARDLPGSLKLESWWQHISQQPEPAATEGFADLELRSCFVPMQSARAEERSHPAASDVEAAVPDISSAVAATDLPAESAIDLRAPTAAQLV